MKISFTALFAAAAIATNAQAAVVPSITTPTLHIFGDSLSDVGTLKQMTLGLVPGEPYWEGRFSSGPVWNEYLAKLLGFKLYNKAIGGSTSDNNHSTLIDILNIHIPSTQDQINYFKFTRPLYALDITRSKDIAVLEIGANDFFAEMEDLLSGSLTVDAFVSTLVNTVVDQLEQLRKVGFRNFFVTNLAAIQHTPMASSGALHDVAAKTVTQYNQLFAQRVGDWARSASDLQMFALGDIGGFVETTIKSAAVTDALGLKDTVTACVNSNLGATASLNAMIMSTSGNNGTCSDPSTNYFMDGVHPAERVQRLYGYYSWQLVSAALNNSVYELSEANLLSLISKYNLGTAAPKPVAV